MMHEFIAGYVDFVLSSNFPLIGLLIISFAESSFFPIPPDVIMIPLALITPSNAIIYGALTTLFSVLGGMLGYFIGQKGGKPLVNRFISEEKLYKVKLYYNQYDVWAIIIAGFSPIPYKLFTISAGLFDLNFGRFVVASIIGRGGRFLAVGTLIFFFGAQIKEFLTNYLELATIAFSILLIGGFFVINKLLKSKINKKK
ncbi:MAG: YqaA family protein [Patescibacteria group bacterium]